MRLGSREPGAALAARAQTKGQEDQVQGLSVGASNDSNQTVSSAIANPSHVLSAGTNDGRNDSPFRSHFYADDT